MKRGLMQVTWLNLLVRVICQPAPPKRSSTEVQAKGSTPRLELDRQLAE